jgi:type I restriction enzyme, S subunit
MSFTESLDEVVKDNRNGLLSSHRSWKRVSISDIASILNGFAFPSDKFSKAKGMPLLRIRDLLPNFTETYFEGDYDPLYVVRPGDLLIGMDGDFNCTIWKGPEALLNQRVCKISVKENYFDKEFMTFLLPGYLSAINSGTSSVTVKHLSSRTIAEIPLPLPPLPEQHRIVARIEELFSRLDVGVEGLQKAKAQLQHYRQSVLKAAVDGRLTAEWRKVHPEVEPADKLLRRIELKRLNNKKRLKSIQDYDLSNPPHLPDTWIRATIDQVSDLITDGDHNPPKRTANGIPHLTAKNIRNWRISEDGCTYITKDDFESVRKRYNPLANDVIITCVGSVGRTAIVPEDYIFSADRNLAAVRLVPNGMEPRFLQYNLNTSESQRAILNASGSTAQPHFYLGDIKAFPVALAPTEEQQEIINDMEHRFSIIDELEVQFEFNKIRSNRLRQSILKRAFEGKLVLQDPNDEPASLLLERIRAERTKESPSRGRGRSINQVSLIQ